MVAEKILRRQAIPVLYTRGTHYEVGFDMGRTFRSMIQEFLELSEPLNQTYIPLYNTDNGKKVYKDTLSCVKKSFPQYVQEIEGIADGAQVEFYKLFLMHMDDITPQSIIHNNSVEYSQQPVGCSTVILNGKNNRVLGHTEDALSETLNNYYIVVAHIINESPQGRYRVKEERFMSLCYAGLLPGYTMSHNHHGLIFSINTLSAGNLRSGKTPRTFITRALLAVENYKQALQVIKDTGNGAADGCSINMSFVNDEPRMFYNIEMAPVVENSKESQINILEIPEGNLLCHANKYERCNINQVNPFMMESSISRMETLENYPAPKNKEDVMRMLGDDSVFVENNLLNQPVKTICVGIFDLNAKTYTLYSDNPHTTKEQITLPLILKN